VPAEGKKREANVKAIDVQAIAGDSLDAVVRLFNLFDTSRLLGVKKTMRS
jgi:hypothetical protein